MVNYHNLLVLGQQNKLTSNVGWSILSCIPRWYHLNLTSHSTLVSGLRWSFTLRGVSGKRKVERDDLSSALIKQHTTYLPILGRIILCLFSKTPFSGDFLSSELGSTIIGVWFGNRSNWYCEMHCSLGVKSMDIVNILIRILTENYQTFNSRCESLTLTAFSLASA